ncbi:MAG TPA: transposase [Ktedonobacterales bacterium]|nr:transposase [Ktedonobacterales bacterium]
MQGANRYNSFTYKQFGNGATGDNGLLVLSKIGRIALRGSRPIEGPPTSGSSSREADGWYACCSGAEVPTHPLAPTAQATGIVLGLESFAPLADGTPVDNPRCNCNAERRLKRVQRCVSRRQKGSQRRKSAVKLLAKAHQKLKRQRQRQDSHHTAALALVRQHDAIYDEDLQVRNLVRNHHLAKRISAAGWSRFLRILSFQAAYAGRTVIAVDPACTSRDCSGPNCGERVWKDVSVRWHARPRCGVELHRGHNAARNILALGREHSGEGHSPQART